MFRKMWIENEGAFYHVMFFSNSIEFIFYLLSFSLTPISRPRFPTDFLRKPIYLAT